MEILDLAKEAVKAALDKKAIDVVVLRMNDLTIITDYFVIATSSNSTQAKAIANSVEKVMKESGQILLSREGLMDGKWILLDYGCIIVHIFLEETRRFYDLEALWGDAEVIDYSG